MKILHIIDSLGLGGAQTVVKGIFEAQKKNNDIFLYALRKQKITIQINHQNIKSSLLNNRYSIRPLLELKKIIDKEKIEILHCHLPRSQVFGYLLKKIYFPNIKIIFHEHGEIFENLIIYNWFINYSKDKVDLIIAVSKSTKQKLIQYSKIPENKISILYNFVDLDKFNKENITWNIQDEKEKLGIKKNEFVIGFVGRLSKIKGSKYLIKSLIGLDFNFIVLIAGDGPEKRRLEKLSKELNVSDKIIFLGYRKDVALIYSLLDLLVMPSLSEASPMAFYEAQAFGIPIVGSNITGINEFVVHKKNGLLFKVKNSEDLKKKISQVYNNKKLIKKLRENSITNIKKYSLTNFINKLSEIYEKL